MSRRLPCETHKETQRKIKGSASNFRRHVRAVLFHRERKKGPEAPEWQLRTASPISVALSSLQSAIESIIIKKES